MPVLALVVGRKGRYPPSPLRWSRSPSAEGGHKTCALHLKSTLKMSPSCTPSTLCKVSSVSASTTMACGINQQTRTQIALGSTKGWPLLQQECEQSLVRVQYS